jgi:GNAT superfamily N-acetyltransferase
VAFLAAGLVDGNAHVDEVSVHPARARQGLGRSMIEKLGVWARDRGLWALTLTTFEDVPWNAPYGAVWLPPARRRRTRPRPGRDPKGRTSAVHRALAPGWP